jgi:hypothetical protein
VLLAMIAMGLTLFWALSPRGGQHEAAHAAPVVQTDAPAAVKSTAARQEQPAPKAEADASSRQEHSVAPVAVVAALSAPVAPPPQEQVATSRTASIKAQPEQRAQVLRSVPPKVILTVFDKKNDWLQVGSTYAWGWVHSSSVHVYSPAGAPATATAR